MPRQRSDARAAALNVLSAVRKGRPFDRALDAALRGLADPDRRLAHELAAGVLRSQQSLDDALSPLVTRGWSSVAPPLQDVLRLSAYQLTRLNRIPAHAAVDSGVALARATGGEGAARFANAVLRKLQRADGPPPSAPSADDVERLSSEYSHPAWLVARWVDRWGATEVERLLRWNNSRPRLVLQAAREPLDALAERLAAVGIEARPAPYGAGLVVNRAKPAALPGYSDGAFVVQDPAQSLLAWYADLPPGTRVYDACAAPGGKTIALGRGGVRVVAGDVSRTRVRRLVENLARAGTGSEHAVVADAALPPVRPLDAVVLDAPCLGTGTFARHPDARWRVSPEALAQLSQAQARLLDGAAGAVAPGGWLVYATCSLEPEENELQVDRFLAAHPEFVREPSDTFPPALLSPKGDLVILPQRHDMDGAFAARLRRRS